MKKAAFVILVLVACFQAYAGLTAAENVGAAMNARMAAIDAATH